jgi:spore coat polysaccharide biosynthesis protein SpsF (cytidylyltransferase family)
MVFSEWIIIIEARMNSSRLPGKVMLDFSGLKCIELMIHRISLYFPLDNIVIATTDMPSDDELVNFLSKKGVKFFRGSESNVMDRVFQTGKKFNRNKIISLTGDCPLIDYRIIKRMCNIFDQINVDYMNNFTPSSFPDGMEVQLFTLEALKSIYKFKLTKNENEHVGLVFRNHKDTYTSYYYQAGDDELWPKLGLTLDEESDAILIQRVLDYFSPRIDFSCAEIIELFINNPELEFINFKVERRY